MADVLAFSPQKPPAEEGHSNKLMAGCRACGYYWVVEPTVVELAGGHVICPQCLLVTE